MRIGHIPSVNIDAFLESPFPLAKSPFNSYLPMPSKMWQILRRILSPDANFFHGSEFFTLSNSEKSDGARSGEYGG
jgi:hypothetical protein